MKNKLILMYASVLFLCLPLYSLAKENNIVLVKSNLMGITMLSELNIYIETVDRLKRKGIEIGFVHHPPKSLCMELYTSVSSSMPTRTGGNPYGLATISTPIFIAAHRGFSFCFNYKIYNRKLEKFYGPQIVLGYRQLLNGYFTHHDFEGPGFSAGYYWYRANHYSKRLALLINLGRTSNISKRFQTEKGFALGLNFNFDNLQLLEWGAATQYPDSNFVNYDKMKQTKHTDGFHITPALRLYFKIGMNMMK